MTEQAEQISPQQDGSRIHGGHVVARVLEDHGVEYVFGQDSPEWFYEALEGSKLTAVTMRDERSAGFAADAVARVTGRPAIACGIHGPGALNLTTALLEARDACSPVVALVSGIETYSIGTGAFQEADHVEIARPLVKWSARVERADRLAQTVDRGLRIAMAGRRGPVLIELPNDLMAAAQPDPGGASAPTTASAPLLAASVPATVIDLIAASARPALLAGNGARMAGAREALVGLAERLGAPVAVTAMGRGAFPEGHPLFAGVIGWMSDREDGSGAVANRVFKDADLVISFGSALDHVTTDGGRIPAPGVPLVRIDVDPERLALGSQEGPALLADARQAGEAILGAFPGDPPADGWAPLEALWTEVRGAQRRRSRQAAAVGVNPARLFTELAGALGPEDLVVSDAAYSSVWALSYLQEGLHFSAMTYGRAAGTLGFGLPAAIGLATAFPGRRVIALAGDGGFGFGWGELETLVRERLQVVCIVLNNGCFAYQKLWHEMNDGVSRGLDFSEVRHDMLAHAVGASGYLVERPEQLGTVLASALAAEGPAVLDVRIDPEILPPFNLYRHVGK